MQVWILKLGHETVVTENFRNAIRHVAAAFYPDKGERQDAKPATLFPRLAPIGAAGSFAHFLRYHNELTGCVHFSIEEHHACGPPGHPSIVRSIDCFNGADPSYLLQRSIWELASGRDKRNPEEIAEALELEVRGSLTRLRTSLTDEECLESLRDLQTRFNGHAVIPQFGSATRILDLVPDRCRSAFLDVSAVMTET
jgi:hypothetical protein